jgi:soluble lytic murein transglycosylase
MTIRAAMIAGFLWAAGAQGSALVAQGGGHAPVPSWHLVGGLSATRADPAASATDSLLELVRAELVLGRGWRAHELMDVLGDLEAQRVDVLELRAAAYSQAGAAAEAGRLLAAAAARAERARQGVLWARAGVAYEAASELELARNAYRQAAALLSTVRGWIALRQARMEDNPVRAFEQLKSAPPAARPLVARVRADLYLRYADTTQAIMALESAGRPIDAAAIAQSQGDTPRARALLYRALRDADTGISRSAARIVMEGFPPAGSSELTRLAGVVRNYDLGSAVELIRRAVVAGDSSAGVLRLLGDLESALGRPSAALAAYERARQSGGGEGTLAEYRRARLLIAIGRAPQGYAALEAFAREHPGASQAPIAAYLVAERAMRVMPQDAANALLRWVATSWPRHTYGSRSRIQLAALALRHGDHAAALDWYRQEIGVGGEQRFAARFFTAQTRQALGDTAGARAHWARLAVEDSLGYYGTAAREAAGLAGLNVTTQPPPPLRPWLAEALQKLDVLRDAGLDEEVRTLVTHLMDTVTEPEAALQLAEGLSGRGWIVEGIRVGWRVAGQRSLHDARVLRVIYPYPWPVRTLIEREAIEHGVDPYLLAAVVRQESAFREAVTSRAGARGLMQLMPSTAVQVARQLGVEWDKEWLAVADANLHLGAAHLAALLRRYESVVSALAAYNAGGTPVARWIRLPEASDPYRFIELIPYAETRGYVQSVVLNHSIYRALYPPAGEAVIDEP